MDKIKEAIRKRKDFEAQLIEKALTDDAFRNLLLNDPKKAMETVAGKAFPSELNVNVIEETADTITITLPPKISETSEKTELSDEALDGVSGGILGGVVAAAISDTGVVVYGLTGKSE